MVLIAPPPKIGEILSQDPTGISELMKKAQTQDFQKILQLANYHYMHWHKVRYYRPMPEGVSPEEIWFFLKLGRESNKKNVPFFDKNNNPFSYWVPDSLLKILHEIDLGVGGTIRTDRPGFPPPKEEYIVSSLMEEAIASSQLEGAGTTRQVAKEMLRSGRKPKDKSEQMILNNWESMNYIRHNRNKKFTPERLLQLHSILTLDTMKNPEEAGRLRTSDDIEVEYNQQTVHIPPLAISLKERIEKLCDFANRDDEENWIHPVLKAAMIHFRLAYDHPFTDGNGRTARQLMYWYLLSRKYFLFEYLAISKYFIQSPGRYVRSYLYTESDGNDLTYFLLFNLRAIRRAILELRRYIVRKQEEVASANDSLKSLRGLNPRQKILLHHAIGHPTNLYTIETHKNRHAIVYQTARNDLLSLVKKGFLRKEKQGKEFVFSPTKKILNKFRSE